MSKIFKLGIVVLSFCFLISSSTYSCINNDEYNRAKALLKENKKSQSSLFQNSLRFCSDNKNSEICANLIIELNSKLIELDNNFKKHYPNSGLCNDHSDNKETNVDCSAYQQNAKSLEKKFFLDRGCQYGDKTEDCKKKFNDFIQKLKDSHKDYPVKCYRLYKQ